MSGDDARETGEDARAIALEITRASERASSDVSRHFVVEDEVEDEDDVRLSSGRSESWTPSSGSAMERLRALEDELREMLGERVVEEAMRGLKVDGEEDEASAATAEAPEPRAETPRPREKLDLAPTPMAKEGPEGKSASRRGASASATANARDDEPWDPYAAFIGIRRQKEPERPREVEPHVSLAAAASKVMIPLDKSLTHGETLRLVADLEKKVKPASAADSLSPNLHLVSEPEVIVEDVKDETVERNFTQQYTREDAATILELAGDAPTGLWMDTAQHSNLRSRAPLILSTATHKGKEIVDDACDLDEKSVTSGRTSGTHARDKGSGRAPKIAGVETVAEFRQLMASIFEEGEDDHGGFSH